MTGRRNTNRHLWNFAKCTTVCGRRADPADIVASVLEADCRVCSTEFARWATNLGDLVEIAGPRVFAEVVATATGKTIT